MSRGLRVGRGDKIMGIGRHRIEFLRQRLEVRSSNPDHAADSTASLAREQGVSGN